VDKKDPVVLKLSRLIDKMADPTISESYDSILADVSAEDARCFIESASVIHEANVSFSVTQGVVLKSLVDNANIVSWARANVPGWDKLSTPAKVNELVARLGQSGFHAARKLASHYNADGGKYDLPDVEDASDFDQILNSRLGKDLRNLFIHLLSTGRTDF
jgi:hypothetical protein